MHPTTHSGPTALDSNPLSTLLSKCNTVAEIFSLPLLYAHKTGVDSGAFHLSLAWTLDGISEDEKTRTEKLLDDDGVKGWEIDVEGVKVKIGNVVTHVPLGARSADRTLFG